MAKFLQGFASNSREAELTNVPVHGQFPTWLKGSLLRTGPAIFEVGKDRFLHWFDGLGMLYRFDFEKGQVGFKSRLLESQNYKRDMAAGRITTPQFGTNPKQNFFSKLAKVGRPARNDNGIVNIVRSGNDFLAVTEAPDMLQFEPRSLGAIGVYEFKDALKVQVSSAHPHYDFERNTLINFALEFGPKNIYHFYGLKDGSRQRQIIASLPTRHPSYIHSFGTTENYIVLVEFPLFFNVLALATSMKTFAESATWQPENGAFFHLIRKDDGALVKTYEAAPFFCFHHINAYEENGDVIVDLAAYYDSEIVQSLYLKALHAPGGGTMPHSQFRRYRLAANATLAEYTPITPVPFEIPHLNYRHNGSKPYRYAYGMSWRKERPNDFYNALIKVDTHTGEVKRWFADDCYPGEPVFVPRPAAKNEDDGVNLSIVLDGDTKRSFLLALDSATFEEVGRAELPNFIPFHFHGGFTSRLTN